MHKKEKGAADEAWDHKVADGREIAGTGAVADPGEVFMIESGDTAASVEEKIDCGVRSRA